jgi:hypothetical protein
MSASDAGVRLPRDWFQYARLPHFEVSKPIDLCEVEAQVAIIASNRHVRREDREGDDA